jgi:hypothetical protein
MTLYRIIPDVDRYQFFLPVDRETVDQRTLWFDCQSVQKTWQPPAVYIQKPKLKRGSFFSVAAGGAIAVDEPTRNNRRVAELLEMSGEILPLPHEKEVFYLLNALPWVDALNREQSEWHGKTRYGMPRRFVFHRSRIPNTPLFKIPEMARGDIMLCHEGLHDPAFEFKRMYEQLGLTGLEFMKIWSDDAD